MLTIKITDFISDRVNASIKVFTVYVSKSAVVLEKNTYIQSTWPSWCPEGAKNLSLSSWRRGKHLFQRSLVASSALRARSSSSQEEYLQEVCCTASKHTFKSICWSESRIFSSSHYSGYSAKRGYI